MTKILNGLLIVTLVVLFGCSASSKQTSSIEDFSKKDLYHKWIRIGVEKKDGSRYVERNITANTIATLTINSNYAYEMLEGLPPGTPPLYWKNDSVFSGVDSYKIIEANDSILIVLQNDDLGSDDKVNKFTYINEDRYYQYLANQKLVSFDNDTIINLNRYFLPFYTRGWQNVIYTDFNESGLNGYFAMEVTLDSEGHIYNSKVVTNHSIPEKTVDRINRILERNISWNFDHVFDYYYFKINFVVYFTSRNDYNYAGVKLFVTDINDNVNIESPLQLSLEEIKLTNHYFKEGLSFYEQSQFDSSIYYFTKCIEIDSLYIEAYYNRAAINLILEETDKSCSDWEFLYKTLGQTTGEILYNEYCIGN